MNGYYIYHLAILLFLGFYSPSFYAQSSYDEAIQLGDNAFENDNFEMAKDYYFAAQAFDVNNNQSYQIKSKIDRVWKAVEALRENALELSKDVIRAKRKVDSSLNETKIQARRAQSLALATIPWEYLDENPVKALRLAELAWNNVPEEIKLDLQIQKIVSKAYLNFVENKYHHGEINFDQLESSEIRAFDFSKDGKKILLISSNDKIKILDSQTFNLIMTLNDLEPPIQMAKFSIDGSRILVISNEGISIWDSDSYLLLNKLDTDERYKMVYLIPGKEQLLAWAGRNAGIVNLIDMKTGLVIKKLSPEVGAYRLTPSYDGKKFMITSFGKISRLWNFESEEPAMVNIRSSLGSFRGISFSPDSKKILTRSHRGGVLGEQSEIKILNAKTGNQLNVLSKKQTKNVHRAYFSPDSKKIATVSKSNDKTAKLWDVESGRLLHVLNKHTKSVHHAAFSNDNNMVATVSDDRSVKIWNVETGRLVIDFVDQPNMVLQSVFSNNRRKILMLMRDKAFLYEITTGKLLYKFSGSFDGKSIKNAKFSPDDNKLYIVSGDNKNDIVRIYNMEPKSLLFEVIGSYSSIQNVNYFNRGAIVINFDNGITKLYDINGDKWLGLNRHLHNGQIFFGAETEHNRFPDKIDSTTMSFTKNVVVSLKGKRIATISSDNTLTIWDSESGALKIHINGFKGKLITAKFSEDGKKIITLTENGNVNLWDTESGTLLFEPNNHKLVIKNARLSQDGNRLITISKSNRISVWNLEKNQIKEEFVQQNNGIENVLFCSRSNKILVTSKDNYHKILDAMSLNEVLILEGKEKRHIKEITQFYYLDEVNSYVTVSNDAAIMWQAETGKFNFELHDQDDNIETLYCSPLGDKVLISTNDGVAKMWETSTGRNLFNLISDDNEHYKFVEFSAEGKRFLTLTKNGTAKLWDAKTGFKLPYFSNLYGQIDNLKFSPDSKHIITILENGTVNIWLTPEEVVNWLERTKNLPILTEEDLIDVGVDFIKFE